MFYDICKNSMTVSPSTSDETLFFDLYENFLNDNSKIGYIEFQVYQNSPLYGILPVANAKITVSKPIGNGYFVSKVIMTNSDGKTEPVPVPTVPGNLSLIPKNVRLYSTYNATVEAQNFLTTDVFDISVFEGVTSIQPINLIPNEGFNTINHQIYQAKPQRLCETW